MNRRPIVSSVQAGDPPPPRPGTTPEGERLRETLALWASGVTVVTVTDGEEAAGLTVSAFSPVSLHPPLVLVCLSEQAAILPMLLEEGRFTVNLLTEEQRREATLFAAAGPAAVHALTPEGDATLPGALASLACSVHAVYPGGDHRIVVGAVKRIHTGPDAPPLVYQHRRYHGLRDAR